MGEGSYIMWAKGMKSMMTDQELLKRYVGGDEGAFGEVVGRHVKMVYAVARRGVGSGGAEDVVQGVFLLLAERAAKLSVREVNVSGWLFKVTRYCCLNWKRMEQRRGFHERAAGRGRVEEWSEEMGEERRDEAAGVLDGVMEKLPTVYREAVLLRYMEGKSVEETAGLLGVSVEAAGKRATRGLEKLRGFLTGRGVMATAAGLTVVLVEETARASVGEEAKLVERVLVTCKSGGAASKAALLAKGTKAMMTLKAKMIAGMAVGAVVLGLGGWAVYASVAEKPVAAAGAGDGTGTVAASVPGAAPAAAPGVAIDLSTPLKSLESMMVALKAGDREGMLACMLLDPAREPTEMDAMFLCNLAENRMINAARKAWGAGGDQLRRGGATFDSMYDLFKGQGEAGKSAAEMGDTAELRADIPDVVMASLPPPVQRTLQIWAKQPMRFKKEAAGWKFDLDHSMHANLEFGNEAGATVEEVRRRHVATLQGLAGLFDEAAEEIGKGKYVSVAEVKGTLQGRVREMMKAQGVRALKMEVVPADGAGGQ